MSRKVLIALFLPVMAFSETYYVSTTGDAGNPGTRVSPKNVTWVESNLSPGDSAVFLDGTYTETLAPSNSGTYAAYIYYVADVLYGATFYPSGAGDALAPTGDYVRFEGLIFQVDQGRASSIVDASDWGVIDRCRFIGGSDAANQGEYEANFVLGDYWRIQRCFFDREDPDTIGITANYPDDACLNRIGDGLTLYTSDYTIIEQCTSVNASHGAIALEYTPGSVGAIVRNCVTYDSHTGIGMEGGAKNVLIEGNRSYWPSRRLVYQDGHSMQISGDSSQIRFNFGYHDSSNFGTATDLKKYQVIQYLSMAAGNPATSLRTYRNTFVGTNTCDGAVTPKMVMQVVKQTADLSDLQFVSNIFASPNENTVMSYEVYVAEATWQDRYEGNLFYHMVPEGTHTDKVLMTDFDGTDSTDYTVAEAEVKYPGWTGNYQGTPLFSDSTSTGASRSIYLAAASTGVDAGVAPSQVDGAVSNDNEVVVDDAVWFHYNVGGVPYERGDSVWFSTSDVKSEIDSIDYANRKLILTSNVTVENNEPVHIWKTFTLVNGYISRISGTAPDIGASEYPLIGFPPSEPPVDPPATARRYLNGAYRP